VDLRSAQRVVTLALASDLRHFTRDGPRFAVTLREASTAIAAAAGRLDVQLTSHDTLLARAGVAVGKIETGLAVAQAGGGLKFFNEEFQKRRREAQTHGKKFMNYGTARTKLFEILAGIAAGADVDRTKVLEQIFGPPGSKAHWWP
jgi:hypothetical protein